MSFYDTIKSVFNKKQIEQEQEQVPNSINIPSKEDEPEVQIINTNTLGYGSIQSTINFDNTSEDIKKLILNYRDLSTYPEIDIAIQEIVNEAVVLENNENVLSINIETDEISEKIKDIIIEEFKHIISMFEFNKKADEYFRQWYEDGRMYVHNVIDLSKPKDGIQKINILSPFSLNKIKENEKYWYLYKDVKKNIVLKIPPEHISFCPSGLTSADKKMYLSYIHKSIKPFNQLKMLEDAAVIYRITRAPERRVFYVDIGQMNKTKAEAYIAKLMSKFKNKIIYDSATGEVSEKKNTMTMTEDFWLPSSESSSGSRGTKIDTLPAGQNLGEISDIEYFRKKLIKSLGVPYSRFDSEGGSLMAFGNMNGELSRDEVRFSKFINKLRNKFSLLIYDILKKQIILKNIITIEEWNKYKEYINFIWNSDSYFSEVKNSEIFKNRIELADSLETYIGTYFSKQYVMKNVFKLTDEEIEEEQKNIEEEGSNEEPSEDEY